MRQTKTREEILQFLRDDMGSFTPYEISDLTHINPVTVYRVLEFLKEQGLVHHIPAIGKWTACHIDQHDHNHDHGFLICKKCESVEEFALPHACIHHPDFKCEEHVTEVFGLCENCYS